MPVLRRLPDAPLLPHVNTSGNVESLPQMRTSGCRVVPCVVHGGFDGGGLFGSGEGFKPAGEGKNLA